MNEELKIIISAEVSKFKKSVSDAKKSIKDFAKEGFKDLDALGKEFQKYGDAANKVLKATAGAAVGAATALLATSAATSEYREAQAKLTTSFEAAGASAEDAKTTYNDLYRVLGDSDVAVEAANHLGQLTQDQKQLSEWTTICQGVYATFGDSLPIEGLTEAANETAKVGQVTGSLADALNWAGMEGQTFGVQLRDNIEFTKLSNKELEKMNEAERAQYELKKAQFEETEKYNQAVLEAASAEDFFNLALQSCNSESEREALIRDTLNGLYGDASARYEENNAQILAQNEANRKMSDAMAKLGEVMAPVNTMLTELGAEILTQLTPYIEDFADKYLPTIKEVLADVGDKIGICLTWVADNWELISTIGAIILGISVALSAVGTAFGLVNTIAAASPVTWIVMGIVAAVAALTAGVIVCYKHWDQIKAKVHEVVESMKQYVTDVKNDVKQQFTGIKEDIVSLINKAKDGVKTAIDKIRSFFKFDWELPKIKLPHFNIQGKFSLNPPSIPHFSVQWYQHGGVFDSPSLFGYGNGSIGGLGENGAEAVVPLEKNTQWLDRIAERLKGDGQKIVLMIDDRVLGEATVNSINSITAQRGSIPLRLY